MGRMWIAELAEKTAVDEVYLVTRKSLPISRNGKPYLNLKLSDRTGDLDARMWDNASQMAERFEDYSFVRVKGTTVLYQERLQLHIQTLEAVDEATVSPVDFMPRTQVSPEELWERTVALLDTVTDPFLRQLLDRVLADEPYLSILKRAPAGKSIHHARLGGLLEHSLSTGRLVDAICGIYAVTYPGLLDRDLLVTAAFLHDAGKTIEISTDKKFEYTDEGRLLGHVVLGHQLVRDHIAAIDGFPDTLSLHLQHLLLSHHGELQHGSPKRPKTAEAWVLHLADLLDCRVDQVADLLSRLPPGGWTTYQKLYDRYFWRGHPSTNESPAPSDDSDESEDER